MFKRLGLLSMTLIAGAALFAPAAAFAQGPYQGYSNDGYYNGYVATPYEYEGRVWRDGYRDRERRELRREREWREREWART